MTLPTLLELVLRLVRARRGRGNKALSGLVLSHFSAALSLLCSSSTLTFLMTCCRVSVMCLCGSIHPP